MTAFAALRCLLAAAIVDYFDRTARFDRTRLGRRCLLDPTSIAPLLAFMTVFFSAGVFRRALAAAEPAVRRMCALDVPAMARLRRSKTGEARAEAAREMSASADFDRAAGRARLMAARLLDALGAVAPTSHPRLIGGLVARSAATSAA